jgi:hypothetical protein
MDARPDAIFVTEDGEGEIGIEDRHDGVTPDGQAADVTELSALFEKEAVAPTEHSDERA